MSEPVGVEVGGQQQWGDQQKCNQTNWVHERFETGFRYNHELSEEC